MLTDSLSVSSLFTSAASPKGQMQNNIDLREVLLAHGIETSPRSPPPPPPNKPLFSRKPLDTKPPLGRCYLSQPPISVTLLRVVA